MRIGTRSLHRLRSLYWGTGIAAVIGLRDVFGGWGQFQRSGEVGADAGGFFCGGNHPLIEGAADAAALGLVFDDDEADEVATGGQAGGHGILAREHAVEDEGHVVVFEELGDGEHAAGGMRLRASGSRLPELLLQRLSSQYGRGACRGAEGRSSTSEPKSMISSATAKTPGLLGTDEEAVMGVAAEPARPAKAAIVERTIETVTRERF